MRTKICSLLAICVLAPRAMSATSTLPPLHQRSLLSRSERVKLGSGQEPPAALKALA